MRHFIEKILKDNILVTDKVQRQTEPCQNCQPQLSSFPDWFKMINFIYLAEKRVNPL